jgi:hypothetical protein
MVSQAANASIPIARASQTLSRGAAQATIGGQEALRAVDQVDNESGSDTQTPYRREQRTGGNGMAQTPSWDNDAMREALQALAERRQVRTGVAVLRSLDRTVGTLLDIMA